MTALAQAASWLQAKYLERRTALKVTPHDSTGELPERAGHFAPVTLPEFHEHLLSINAPVNETVEACRERGWIDVVGGGCVADGLPQRPTHYWIRPAVCQSSKAVAQPTAFGNDGAQFPTFIPSPQGGLGGPAVEKRFRVVDAAGERTLIVPQGCSGDPTQYLLDTEARTNTRLRDGENPVWFFKLYEDFMARRDPAADVSFAEYCARRHADKVDIVLPRPVATTTDQLELPDLNANQDAIYRVLTGEYQKASAIATASRVDDGEVRRQLPNLKRMGLVEHERYVGYRRKQ